MESLESFKKRFDSVIDKAYQGGVTLLPFLDEAEYGYLESEIKKYSGINYFSNGGIENSERKRYVITPYDSFNDFKINVFQIIYNKKFYSLYHRSILGSLMSLGIKRECLGDIYIDKDLNAYFAVTDEITNFILNEFKFVGKCAIELKLVDYPIYMEANYIDETCFLASVRLDSVVSQGFNVSRSNALEMIEEGLVMVNHVLNQNPSHKLKENDLISVRHKGRLLVKNIGGVTKSGRIVVTIAKRI